MIMLVLGGEDMAKKNRKEDNKLKSQMTSMIQESEDSRTSKTGFKEMMPNSKQILKK